jgi:dTDP-4-amino-4,6-dideoxygalactose transaminase
MNLISHSKPWITKSDVLAVSNVLQSGMLAQGEIAAEFERTLSSWVGAYDGVATGRGAAAIVLALAALDIGDGDEVVLPMFWSLYLKLVQSLYYAM